MARDSQAASGSTIAFVSSRDNPAGDPRVAAEVYLMGGDGTNPRRLTDNSAGDGFPALAPDGKTIAFESTRLRVEGEPPNDSDLFLMNADGTEQTRLTRGSSATWSPDGRSMAFHASASGSGRPIKPDPGAATIDSDIFVMSLDASAKKLLTLTNITTNPTAIDDDPDWSPQGDTIVFTSHAVTDDHVNSVTAEIYTISATGSGKRARLTTNAEEERAPAWSPDGKRLAFMCRRGGPDFEICVMNADGTGQVQVTDNAVADLTPTWSPDGQKILFHRAVAGRFQLFLMNRDGTGLVQLTDTPGMNAFPNWSPVRARSD